MLFTVSFFHMSKVTCVPPPPPPPPWQTPFYFPPSFSAFPTTPTSSQPGNILETLKKQCNNQSHRLRTCAHHFLPVLPLLTHSYFYTRSRADTGKYLVYLRSARMKELIQLTNMGQKFHSHTNGMEREPLADLFTHVIANGHDYAV